MRPTAPFVLAALALLVSSPVLAGEGVEHRKVIIKVATEEGAGLSTFDLSDLALGESREITADDGRVLTATRDEAGILLDLGNGKTMRLAALEEGLPGAHAIHLEGGTAARTMVFHDAAGGTTVLEGGGGEWTEGQPHKVMVFRSADGTTHTLNGEHGVEWTGEGGEGEGVKIVKKVVVVDGEAHQDIELLVEQLGGEGGTVDAEQLRELVEAATAEACPEGEECTRKVIVITKKSEDTVED